MSVRIGLFWCVLTLYTAGCAGGDLNDQTNNNIGQPPYPTNGKTTDPPGTNNGSTGGTNNPNPNNPNNSKPNGLFDVDEPMTIVQHGTNGMLLHGTVLTPYGGLSDSQVLVVGNSIVCVAEDCTTEPGASNATWIATRGVISPGLIDAHNHLIYNFLPEWFPPNGETFTNRYQWSDHPDYEAHIAPIANRRSTGSHVCPASRWGELRSLMHGTTTMMGQSPNQSCVTSGVRNADHAHGLHYDHMQTSIGSPRDVTDDQAASFIANLDKPFEPTTRIAIHMQEGISGNNILLEFESWAGRDTRQNRHQGVSLLHNESSVLIHSMSLTPEQLDEVAITESKIVWSPSSNFALYGGTAPIEAILEREIMTGIGPDWTVSGEPEMLSELRFARAYGTQTGIAALTPQKLWEMATTDGAEVVGLGGLIGRVEVGYRADIAVFASVEQNPYIAVFENRAWDIGLVLIDGEAYYGESALQEYIARNSGCEAIDVCGVEKFVCAREPSIPRGEDGVPQIRQALIDILEGTGYPPEEQYGRGDDLLELVDCEA